MIYSANKLTDFYMIQWNAENSKISWNINLDLDSAKEFPQKLVETFISGMVFSHEIFFLIIVFLWIHFSVSNIET